MGASYSTDEMYNSVVESDLNDLSGKVVAITGTSPNSMGAFIAKAATMNHAKCVILMNRPSDRSAKAEEEIKSAASDGTTVITIHVDLLSFESVKTAAEELNKVAQTYGGLDVLGCNAGIMAKDDIRTADGYDVQMQANQLSHYLLTKLCMQSLEMAAESRGEARVVFHSSSARTGLTKSNLEPKYFQKCDPGTLGGDETMSPPWERYHQTKLANSAFAMALNDQLKEKGSKVKSLACDPGFATTDLVKNSDADESSWLLRCMTFLSSVLNASQSPANGSLSFVLCAFAPDSESGDFYMPSARGGMVGKPKKTISRGVPLKEGDEALTVSAENKTTVMEQCQKVFGFASTL